MRGNVFSNNGKGEAAVMMNAESGAPAFDNIDELLTDKIVSHGRDHADRTDPDNLAVEPETLAAPVEHLELGNGPSGKMIILAFAALGIVLLILYRLLNRQQNR
jgi:hypothetical protein